MNKVLIIVNILLGVIKFFIMIYFSLAAFLDDYIIRLTKLQQYSIFSVGVIISILLDIVIHLVLGKCLLKENKYLYKKTLLISLIITVIEAILLIISN